jgi:hypothetical protein
LILNSVNGDEIAFQQEQYAKVSDSKPIFLRARGQFLDVTRKIILKEVEASTDVLSMLRSEGVQLLPRFLASSLISSR